MGEYALRLENGTDTAPRVRMGDALGLFQGGSLTSRSGLRPDGGGVVSVVAGTMGVQVTPLMAWVDGGTSTAQAGYPFVLDATKTLTLSDGHATLSRTDVVAIVIREDSVDGSGFTTAAVEIVEGTAGAGVPALPATSIPLREVTVPAGLSAGTGGLASGNLSTDRRQYLAATGGILPVASATERDALANLQAGQAVYRVDTEVVQVYNGTAWESYTKDQARAGLVAVSGTQSIAHNSSAQVTLGTTSYNSGLTVGSSGITVATAGLHTITAGCTFNSGGGAGRRTLQLRVNGTVVTQSDNDGTNLNTRAIARDLTLAAGDVVTIWAFQTSGGALTVRNDVDPAYLTVRRVCD